MILVEHRDGFNPVVRRSPFEGLERTFNYLVSVFGPCVGKVQVNGCPAGWKFRQIERTWDPGTRAVVKGVNRIETTVELYDSLTGAAHTWQRHFLEA